MNENNVYRVPSERDKKKQFLFCFALENVRNFFITRGIIFALSLLLHRIPWPKSSMPHHSQPNQPKRKLTNMRTNRICMMDNEQRTTIHKRNEVYDFIDIPHVLFSLWHSKYCKNVLLFFRYRSFSSTFRIAFHFGAVCLNTIQLFCLGFVCFQLLN